MMNKKLVTSTLLVLLMAGMTSAVSLGTTYDTTTDFNDEATTMNNVVVANDTVKVDNMSEGQGTIKFPFNVDSTNLATDNLGLGVKADLEGEDGLLNGQVTVEFLDENDNTIDTATVQSFDNDVADRTDVRDEDVRSVRFTIQDEDAVLKSFTPVEESNNYLLGEIVNQPLSVSDDGQINYKPDSQSVAGGGSGEVTLPYGKWILMEENDQGNLERVDESQWVELTPNGEGDIVLTSEQLASGFLQPAPFQRDFDQSGDYAYSLVLAEAHSEYNQETDTWEDPDGASEIEIETINTTIQENAGTYDISMVDAKTYKFSVESTPAPTDPVNELQKFFDGFMRGLYSVF